MLNTIEATLIELGASPDVRARAEHLLEVLTTRFHDAEHLAMLERALALSLRCADGTDREGTPYFIHIADVTGNVLEWYENRDDAEVVAAALLHDSVEDAPERLADTGAGSGADVREQALAAIAGQLSLRVADLVRAVTNPNFKELIAARHGYAYESSPYDATLLNMYCQHLVDLCERGPLDAAVIKFADMRDNAVTVGESKSEGTYAWRVRKYRPTVAYAREFLRARVDADHPVARAAAALLPEFDAAWEAFYAARPRPASRG